MKYLVIDLQKKSLDDTASISTLLREALIVSKKLNLKEFEEWINLELSGYNSSEQKIPSYRKVFGECKAFNPYNGWIPVVFNDTETASIFTTSTISQPLSELEFLINCDNDSHNICISYSSFAESKLRECFDLDFKYQLFVGKSQIQRIIEHIRNTILNWALELEADGILGEEMIFSKEEKQIATTKNYNTYNFYGAITDSQIQQSSNNSIQSKK